jgi:hypothetical protein
MPVPLDEILMAIVLLLAVFLFIGSIFLICSAANTRRKTISNDVLNRAGYSTALVSLISIMLLGITLVSHAPLYQSALLFRVIGSVYMLVLLRIMIALVRSPKCVYPTCVQMTKNV